MCSNASLKTWTSLHNCFVDEQLIIWLICFHSLIKRDFSWATSWIRLRYTRSCSFLRSCSLLGWGQDCWLARQLERWSLVLNELTVVWSCVPYGQEHCLSAKVTSRLVTALLNVMETGIFCRRYSKVNPGHSPGRAESLAGCFHSKIARVCCVRILGCKRDPLLTSV